MFKKHKIAKNKKRQLRDGTNNQCVTRNEQVNAVKVGRGQASLADLPSRAKKVDQVENPEAEQGTMHSALSPATLQMPMFDSIAVEEFEVVEEIGNYDRPEYSLANRMAVLQGSQHGNNMVSTWASRVVTSTSFSAFSWHQCFDWANMTQHLAIHEGLATMVKRMSIEGSVPRASSREELSKRMQSLFWPTPAPHINSIPASAELILKFLFSTLVNNMVRSGDTDHVHCQSLIRLPPKMMTRLFRRLPAPVVPIFRDVLFLAAIREGSRAIVSWMLRLYPELGSYTYLPEGYNSPDSRRPITRALELHHYDIAKTLIQQQCQNATSVTLKMMTNEIIIAYWHSTSEGRLGIYRYRELLYIPVNALGNCDQIQLNKTWYRIAMGDEALIKRLLSLQRGRIKLLIEQRQFNEFFRFCRGKSSKECAASAELVLSWIHQESVVSDCLDQPGLKHVLDRIQEDYTNDWLCDMAQDFRTRYGIAQADARPSLSLLSITTLDRIKLAIDRGLDNDVLEALNSIKLSDAKRGGRDYVYNYNECHVFCELLEGAMVAKEDQIAVNFILARQGLALQGMVMLMMHNRLEAVSMLLHMDTECGTALVRAQRHRDFHDLELLFRSQNVSFLSESDPSGIVARAVAYLAIHISDRDLLHFILDSGRISEKENSYFFQYFQFFPFRYSNADESISLPSVLAVAASVDNIPMVHSLATYGIDARHEKVLEHAIRLGSSISAIGVILDLAVGDRPPYWIKGYGAPGIIEAVRQRNYDVLDFILQKTAVNAMDRNNHMTPLGQAVLQQDVSSVQILLNHGAKSGKCFMVQEGSRSKSPFKETHYTPILLAVQVENIALVRLLVDNGASVNHNMQHFIRRSPLQMAAEIGNFEMVQYLLSEGAEIDFNCMHNSGTALQLAAIQGYVGIANLLLHHGANVNAMPARGHGRTALEGAAEWGRLDMILLLFKHGTDFDLQVGDDHKPQAERAIHFARENSHASLARFVEYLWKQQQDAKELHRFQLGNDGLDLESISQGIYSNLGDMPIESPIANAEEWFNQFVQ